MDLYQIDIRHTGRGEGLFHEVLPRDLTIDEARHYPIDYSLRTLFKEVKIKPYPEQKYKSLLNIRPIKRRNWQRVIFDKFCRVIEKNYTPGCIVSLSSGYDSRLIARAMCELGYTPEYYECFSEKHFIDIVKYLRIKTYRIWGANKPHRERLMDFLANPIDGYDGVVGLHLNPFYEPVPDNSVIVTGCGCNTLTGALSLYKNYFAKMGGINFADNVSDKVNKIRRYSYYSQLIRYIVRGRAIRPFSDLGFIGLIAGIKDWQVVKKRFSLQILEAIDPGLARIPRVDPQDLIKQGYRDLPDNAMRKIQSGYDKSWYGRHVPMTVTRLVDNHPFWSHWAASQICEKLIQKNYNIKF